MSPPLSRVFEKYQNDGLVNLLKSGVRHSTDRLSTLVNRIHIRNPLVWRREESGFWYQRSRKEGVEKRWEMIEPHLSDDASVLDIGCNAGLLTSKVAATNRFAVGLERNSATVADALQYHDSSKNFGLINLAVTPHNVRMLPSFDCIFLLSVFHQLYREYGETTAKEMLYQLGKRTSETLFFEPASQTSKYGETSLPFEDFDRKSIIEYNKEFLRDVFKEDCTVMYLGASSRIDLDQGERHLLAVKF